MQGLANQWHWHHGVRVTLCWPATLEILAHVDISMVQWTTGLAWAGYGHIGRGNTMATVAPATTATVFSTAVAASTATVAAVRAAAGAAASSVAVVAAAAALTRSGSILRRCCCRRRWRWRRRSSLLRLTQGVQAHLHDVQRHVLRVVLGHDTDGCAPLGGGRNSTSVYGGDPPLHKRIRRGGHSATGKAAANGFGMTAEHDECNEVHCMRNTLSTTKC